MPKFTRLIFKSIIYVSLFFLAAPTLWGADPSANLLYQKNGDSTDDNLGYSVAGARDVNGDGKADFIIGAPYVNQGGFFDVGSAYIYSGSDGALLYQKSGPTDNDYMGWSVSGAGDVNADAKDDFIVGAPFADTGDGIPTGSVFVFSGADGSLLRSEERRVGKECRL